MFVKFPIYFIFSILKKKKKKNLYLILISIFVLTNIFHTTTKIFSFTLKKSPHYKSRKSKNIFPKMTFHVTQLCLSLNSLSTGVREAKKYSTYFCLTDDSVPLHVYKYVHMLHHSEKTGKEPLFQKVRISLVSIWLF